MARTPKQHEKPETEDAIMERMNEALKRMMNTPHETQKEMIERRRQNALPPGMGKQVAGKKAKVRKR